MMYSEYMKQRMMATTDARGQKNMNVPALVETRPGWWLQPVIAAARMVRDQAVTARTQVKSLAEQPETQSQDQRITGEYQRVSSN